jgi:hypothetical protein
MIFTGKKYFVLLSLFGLLFVGGLPIVFSQEKIWREVTPAELQMKTPQVEPDADAEAIFWEVRLDDKKLGKLSANHYVRVKIFTERGREKFSKLDIPFYKGKKVEDVAARVIKSDGTMINLPPTDIFEREIVSANKIKIKAKSFAVPSIEPGVIVEYQYTEIFKNDSAGGERLLFQRDIPMQRVTYYVRPYKGLNLKFIPFNTQQVNFVEGENRFYAGTMTNVPALKQEPYMPPEDEVRQWTLLSYGSSYSWQSYSNNFSPLQNLMIKPNKFIREQATALTNGVTAPEDKLKKLYTFVQARIKNVTYDKSLSEDQLDDLNIDEIEDVLKKGAGSSFQVNLLYGALASAAGFDVRLFFSSNRSEAFFNPDRVSSGSFLHPAGIGIKVGDKQWRFLDPGTPYLGFDEMFWHDQSVVGMLINNYSHSWVKTSLYGYDKSAARRTGKFNLLEDGTLEGEARIEYTGNQAIDRRQNGFKDSPAQREEDLKKEIREHLSAAEISAVSIENFSDTSKPLTYVFKVRIPGYAQKTGKRLFVQPGYFEYGSSPIFSSATRTHAVYFPYPQSEFDTVEIQLPKGFALDNADAPASIEDPSKIASLKVNIAIDKMTNSIKYERRFYFGGGGNIYFPISVYPALKNMFDLFHKADTHTITLKQN